jgi:hypothetical protein
VPWRRLPLADGASKFCEGVKLLSNALPQVSDTPGEFARDLCLFEMPRKQAAAHLCQSIGDRADLARTCFDLGLEILQVRADELVALFQCHPRSVQSC